MPGDNPRLIRLKEYRPPEFLIDEVRLRFELDPLQTEVRSQLVIRRNPSAERSDGPLTLHGEQLELLAIAIDGEPLPSTRYDVTTGALQLHEVPDAFRLETRVRIHPSRNTALEGLYLSGMRAAEGPDAVSGGMLCTQCEAEGFRRITFFLDRPDVMARFQTTLVADLARFPVLLSNGNLIDQQRLADGRHLATWEDPFPKPSYLFALVAGDLREVEDAFRTASGREVRLQIFVEPHNLDKCDHAMRSLKKAMHWDEVRYGREYDLDRYMIVAVSHFNMGAMENKGLNIFNDKYVLARRDTASDEDFQAIEGVIAHEYFHNWTGNRITCRDWFQLSLKEGFTVYRDQEFSADLGSRGVKRIHDVRLLRAHQFPEDKGPMAHPVRPDAYIEINNFYTATVYNKGAEVVRMLATLLGPGLFRAGTDLYFQRHDGQAVTTDDFVRCMEDVSGRDLTQFRLWYTQFGTPELEVEGDYDKDQRLYVLRVRQSVPVRAHQREPAPMHLPLAIGFLDPEGRPLPMRLAEEQGTDLQRDPSATRVLEIAAWEQRFLFVGVQSPPVLSLLRGFSAPVKLHARYQDAELMHLMRHDTDGFARWDAAQTLMVRWLLRSIADSVAPIPDEVFAVIADVLRQPSSDPALLAELLTPPSETYLGDQMPLVDVDGIHRARVLFLAQVGQRLFGQFMDLYARLQEEGPFRITSEAIGRRALKNRVLGYLTASGDPRGIRLAESQFAAATNMTDQLAALRRLVDHGGEVASGSLASFYRQWRHEPLVLDKWFSVQTRGSDAGTLSRVKDLMGHPDFSLRNPNRVRSLVGVFCQGNPFIFHAQDGSGYRFLAERVLELDPLNPQIAARLLKSLVQWRRYDGDRQRLMRGEIQRILDAGARSNDVYEVASRALQDP